MAAADLVDISKDALHPSPDDAQGVQAQMVGKGAFGVVYQARLGAGPDALPVAVKKLIVPGPNMDQQSLAEMKRESAVMKIANHPNIVFLYGVVSDPRCPA